MDTRHKILLVDDDPELLAMYREILGELPSRPEIHTAATGARAMAMLESNSFRLLICDLRMPKMDGLQVLSIVRRKHPALRTVVLTAVVDEQFRSRVYALGVDLYWQKPGTDHEIKMFLECIESLVGRDDETGFRGMQSKSLVDIIQLECISQSSAVLRIMNGPLSGKIWINDGELIDAETDELRGEAAFQKILSWRTGNFESLSAEPSRERTIQTSYNALLLETAQAIDEERGEALRPNVSGELNSPLAALARVEGVEFVVAARAAEKETKKGQKKLQVESRGLENPERMATWAHAVLERFRPLGDKLQAGPLEVITGLGPHRHVCLARQNNSDLCVGWRHSLSVNEVRHGMRKVLALWVY